MQPMPGFGPFPLVNLSKLWLIAIICLESVWACRKHVKFKLTVKHTIKPFTLLQPQHASGNMHVPLSSHRPGKFSAAAILERLQSKLTTCTACQQELACSQLRIHKLQFGPGGPGGRKLHANL